MLPTNCLGVLAADVVAFPVPSSVCNLSPSSRSLTWPHFSSTTPLSAGPLLLGGLLPSAPSRLLALLFLFVRLLFILVLVGIFLVGIFLVGSSIVVGLLLVGVVLVGNFLVGSFTLAGPILGGIVLVWTFLVGPITIARPPPYFHFGAVPARRVRAQLKRLFGNSTRPQTRSASRIFDRATKGLATIVPGLPTHLCSLPRTRRRFNRNPNPWASRIPSRSRVCRYLQ